MLSGSAAEEKQHSGHEARLPVSDIGQGKSRPAMETTLFLDYRVRVARSARVVSWGGLLVFTSWLLFRAEDNHGVKSEHVEMDS